VEITFELTVAVEDLFIDLSVVEVDQGAYTILDARLGILHLAVTSLSYCAGIVDLDAGFAESSLRPGDGNAGPPATYAGVGAGLANQVDGFSEFDGGVA
jgi:hypothetical protein